jgi:predicted nucleic acid-binding protein
LIIVDTGPLVAALDADDIDHSRCLDLLEGHRGPLLVPAPVLTEVCWLLERERGSEAEAAFLNALVAGEMHLVDLTKADLRRMSELVLQYRDLPLGAVDASVVAVAERIGARQVATLDLRHFNVVKPRHTRTLILLPK